MPKWAPAPKKLLLAACSAPGDQDDSSGSGSDSSGPIKIAVVNAQSGQLSSLGAWELKGALEKLDPTLGKLVDATPPWVEDPLKR